MIEMLTLRLGQKGKNECQKPTNHRHVHATRNAELDYAFKVHYIYVGGWHIVLFFFLAYCGGKTNEPHVLVCFSQNFLLYITNDDTLHISAVVSSL